jgi:hypothetical protein
MTMADQKLEEFFRGKVAKSGPGDLDWEGKKKAWVRAIEALYRKITDDYLARLVKDGTITITYREKELVEDYIGRYSVKELVLTVGDEKVVFSPKGLNVVGATGRVDLIGDMGAATLIRQPGSRWALVAARTPDLRIELLSEGSLLEALRGVMRK